MVRLKLIGYWKSAFEIGLPHPINFIDSNWDETEKSKVIKHLITSPFLPSVCAGYSYCRLCDKQDNGYREQSDGVFIWPEGFTHYVEEHNVKPPQEFIDYCMEDLPPAAINWDQEITIDRKWWKAQEGVETPESKSFIDPYEHTYPKFYRIQLKGFDKDKLKLEFRKFLKEIAQELGMTVVEAFHKLNNNGQELIITEDVVRNIERLSNKSLFITIKTTN